MDPSGAMLTGARGSTSRPDETQDRGAHDMLGKVARIGAGILIGWFIFVLVAMGLAFLKRRDAVEQEPDADEVDLVAAFGPLDFRSTATAFRGGEVDTWFGGGVLDLRGATLDPAGATLEVNALFGGGNLVVPDDWNVELSVAGLGGVSDGREWHPRSPDAPTIRVEGLAMFGGWVVSARRQDGRDEELLPAI